MLACDGTHVGVSLRNVRITAIETPDKAAVNGETCLRRYDRVFLPYRPGLDNAKVRSARCHLLDIAKRAINEDTVIPQPVDEESRNVELVDCLPDIECVKTVIRKFMSRSYPTPVNESLAIVLSMLATDAPVSSMLPYRCLSVFEASINLICVNSQVSLQLNNIATYSPELSSLLSRSLNTGFLIEITGFCQYLSHLVQLVHETDVVSRAASAMPGTYNPERGVTYYFSESPIHGHCYGYHIIDGAEGRKDPFSSLFKYTPVAPKELFYDFSCSLSEYCLNREPYFFRETRFWHDIFHGYSHKCSKAYRSSRILPLQAVNSEICEQFNSYLQCIKYTASHLSQSHYTFFCSSLFTYGINRKLRHLLSFPEQQLVVCRNDTLTCYKTKGLGLNKLTIIFD
jgi:hypothetical protein